MQRYLVPAVLGLLLSPAAHAYPDRPVTVVAQQPPGSGSDAMTRIWSECVGQKLDQTFIVQNKPGANGILAVNYLKGATGDGYTVMTIGMSQMTITPYVYKKQPYDPESDFHNIAVFGEATLVLAAGPQADIKNMADLARVARATPGGINYGSPGKGSPAHLLTASLAEKLGIPSTHIPFVGESAGVTAMIGNQIQVMTLVMSTALPQIKSGKLVPLAVFSPGRDPALPQVPTIGEAADAAYLARPGWIAVVGNRQFPEAAAKTLADATRNCVQDPGFRGRMEAMNVRPAFGDSADVLKRAKVDSDIWKPLIQTLDLLQD